MGTHIYHVMTVIRLVQPMPILTLHSAQLMLDSNLFRPTYFLMGELPTEVWLHDALAPPTEIYKFCLKPFCYVENGSFSFRMQLEDVNIKCKSCK